MIGVHYSGEVDVYSAATQTAGLRALATIVVSPNPAVYGSAGDIFVDRVQPGGIQPSGTLHYLGYLHPGRLANQPVGAREYHQRPGTVHAPGRPSSLLRSATITYKLPLMSPSSCCSSATAEFHHQSGQHCYCSVMDLQGTTDADVPAGDRRGYGRGDICHRIPHAHIHHSGQFY